MRLHHLLAGWAASVDVEIKAAPTPAAKPPPKKNPHNRNAEPREHFTPFRSFAAQCIASAVLWFNAEWEWGFPYAHVLRLLFHDRADR